MDLLLRVSRGHRRSVDATVPQRNFFCTIPHEINSNEFVVFGINEQIRIRIFVAEEIIFFERFEFLVCSKFNHKQCGRTCACALACLYPHNSISNVVAFVTIHDDKMYLQIYFFIRDVAKKKETIVESQRLFQPNITESV